MVHCKLSNSSLYFSWVLRSLSDMQFSLHLSESPCIFKIYNILRFSLYSEERNRKFTYTQSSRKPKSLLPKCFYAKLVLFKYKDLFFTIKYLRWFQVFQQNSTLSLSPYIWKWRLLSLAWLFATPWTVHGILQDRILEWVAFPFSRGSSQPSDWTQDSWIAGRFFTSWAMR